MQQMFFPTNKLLVYKVQTIYFTDLFQKLEILMIKIRHNTKNSSDYIYLQEFQQ